MQIALMIDPRSPEDVAAAQTYLSRHFPGAAGFPEQETEAKQETEPPPFETETEPPTLAELKAKAAEIATYKGVDVLKRILDRVEIPSVSKCPTEKIARLAAELALHA